MAKTMTYQADEAKQIETAVNEYVAEMKQANQRMEIRQVEIDKLRAETRAMLNQIRELLPCLPVFTHTPSHNDASKLAMLKR